MIRNSIDMKVWFLCQSNVWLNPAGRIKVFTLALHSDPTCPRQCPAQPKQSNNLKDALA